MRSDLLILGACWAAFGAVHSLLAAPSVVNRIRHWCGDRFAYYRVCYNLVSFATLAGVLALSFSISSPPLWRWEWPFAVVQYACWAVGVWVFVLGARQYDLREFLGISEVRAYRAGSPGRTTPTLTTSGVLRIVRHPWYFALLLLLWARDVSAVSLVTNGVLTVYLMIGTSLEEKKLVATYGDAYRRYQQEVSMLLPLKWIRRMVWPVAH